MQQVIVNLIIQFFFIMFVLVWVGRGSGASAVAGSLTDVCLGRTTKTDHKNVVWGKKLLFFRFRLRLRSPPDWENSGGYPARRAGNRGDRRECRSQVATAAIATTILVLPSSSPYSSSVVATRLCCSSFVIRVFVFRLRRGSGGDG